MAEELRSLSAADLARDTGIPEGRIHRLVELRILEPTGGAFRPADIQRVRVAEALDRAGTPPEHLAEVIAGGGYTFRWLDTLFEDPTPLSNVTIDDAARDLDLPISLIERTYTVWSIAVPSRTERLRQDDLDILSIVAEVHHTLGREEDRTIAAIRYFGENLRLVAESQIRWFRSAIEEPRIASGTTQPEFAPTTTATGRRFLTLAEKAVDLSYRRHLEHYLLEDVIENIEVALDRAGLVPAGARTPPGIAFVDLSGYTARTEREGDASAAEMSDRFAEIVRTATVQAGGRVVKLLGDGAMLHFANANDAVHGSLDLLARIPAAGLPPAHAGVNAGPVVFRDGDYYGRTVNVAARVADHASAGELLVTEEAVPVPAADDLEFEPVPDASLKGVSGTLKLYRVRRTDGFDRILS